MLIAASVVVQVALIAIGWFMVLHSLDNGTVLDKNSDPNWAQTLHGQILGTMVIPLLAFLLVIASFLVGVPGGIKWALITLGSVMLQIVLAYAGFAVPVLGALHGINAFVIAFAASIAMRKARPAGDVAPAAA
jgi:hypothetical protein